ncbi:DnaD domain protein [Bacillus suaedaesalsae]|uniref:DnaD domain protein n=1 Tax=Bacillus suaedaesalsae TaxID=2810349 RepID=A0ABS2DET2_9BACI|nr:DnaD domain protein [Bacillus suaedaesalsae]MBM6616973.1 DnaD domain protein [Bacillus suaedaesalsae]
MAKFRKVCTDFWIHPMMSEEMTPEDKYFYLYLLTNQNTTQIGIYRITKKQMAFDMGYSLDSVEALMNRFIHHHKLIRYNPETRELAIKNWANFNLNRGGKPIVDCIVSEIQHVQDTSLIPYVAESIKNKEILEVYHSYYAGEEQERVAYLEESYFDSFHDTSSSRMTIRGQEEEKEKEEEKEQQQEKEIALAPNVVFNPETENAKKEDVKEIIEFWDTNGFGFSNINAKQQLLMWLYDSSFVNPKEMILKALDIASSNNCRKLSYVVAILRNWENECILTLEDFKANEEQKKQSSKHDEEEAYVHEEFVLDITAGEDW